MTAVRVVVESRKMMALAMQMVLVLKAGQRRDYDSNRCGDGT